MNLLTPLQKQSSHVASAIPILDWFLACVQIMGNNESKRAEKRTDDHRVRSVVKHGGGRRPGKGSDKPGPSRREISRDSVESEGECLCL